MLTIQAEAVIFDSDGVLVDSHHQVMAAWGLLCERHQLPFDEVQRTLVGVRAEDTLGRYLAGDDLADAIAWLDAEEVRTAGETDEIAGAGALLASLPGDRKAIVTSASVALGRARWAGAGLVVPRVIVTAEDVRRGKPNPEPFLVGASRLSVDPADCVIFEDSPSGGFAAQAAGATVIAVGDQPWAFDPACRVPDLAAVSASIASDTGAIMLSITEAVVAGQPTA